LFARAEVDLLVVQPDFSLIRLFQQIDATQERALAGPAGSQNADHLARTSSQAYSFEHLGRSLAFMDIFNRQFVHEATRVNIMSSTDA
jgi:hypothetical protein